MTSTPFAFHHDNGKLLEYLVNFGIGRRGSAAAYSPDYPCGFHRLWLYRMTKSRAIGFVESTNQALFPFLVTDTGFYFDPSDHILELYNWLSVEYWEKLEDSTLPSRLDSLLPDAMDRMLKANHFNFKEEDKVRSWEQFLSNPPVRTPGDYDIHHLARAMASASINPRNPGYQVEELDYHDSDVEELPQPSNHSPTVRRLTRRY